MRCAELFRDRKEGKEGNSEGKEEGGQNAQTQSNNHELAQQRQLFHIACDEPPGTSGQAGNLL